MTDLQALLLAAGKGDIASFGPLADWLEEHQDQRAGELRTSSGLIECWDETWRHLVLDHILSDFPEKPEWQIINPDGKVTTTPFAVRGRAVELCREMNRARKKRGLKGRFRMVGPFWPTPASAAPPPPSSLSTRSG